MGDNFSNNMKGVRKSAAVAKASATHVRSEGVVLVGKIAAFHSGNFSQEFTTYKYKDAITLLPTNIAKRMAPQPGMIRINEKTGKIKNGNRHRGIRRRLSGGETSRMFPFLSFITNAFLGKFVSKMKPLRGFIFDCPRTPR